MTRWVIRWQRPATELGEDRNTRGFLSGVTWERQRSASELGEHRNDRLMHKLGWYARQRSDCELGEDRNALNLPGMADLTMAAPSPPSWARIATRPDSFVE